MTSYQAGTVTAVAADLSVRTSAEICLGVQGVVVDYADRVFVTCTDTGELVVLDLATLTEIGRVGDLARPDAVTLGTDGTVYVGLQRGPAVVAFDPETLTETGRVTMGDDVAGLNSNIDLLFDAAGRLLLSWPEQDTVLVIDRFA